MASLLKENAYNVLGLDSSSVQKDIKRRSKEIVRRLQIDDLPEYSYDLGIFENFRTENSVKEALQKLSLPKKQIIDYFFWFNVHDDIDEKAIELLKLDDAAKSIELWQKNCHGDKVSDLLQSKNLAILYCYLLFKYDNDEYLNKSLKIWSSLVNSTKFWKAFSKIYKLNDELDTDQQIISDFHKNCSNYLSDLYTELYHIHGDEKYIRLFNETFKTLGSNAENVILNPILSEISIAVEELESMDVSEDGVFDDDEANQIKNSIATIEKCSLKLSDLSLQDSSQVKLLKDRAVKAIRSIAIDIHNNLDEELPRAKELLNLALKFVGTSMMENTLQEDLEVFRNNEQFNSLINPILELEEEKKYDEALDRINEVIEEHGGNVDLMDGILNRKKECITKKAMSIFSLAKELYENKEYDDANEKFTGIIELIYGDIDNFSVNVVTIDKWLIQINSKVQLLGTGQGSQLDDILDEMRGFLNKTFGDSIERYALTLLIESHARRGVSRWIQENTVVNNSKSPIPVWAIFWIIYILFVILGNIS